MQTALHPIAEAEPGRILAKATFRAGQALGLSQRELADAIGVSPASASRMRGGGYVLSGKPFELAACLIRVYRSLDAIVGGDTAALKSWMVAANTDLHGTPKTMMQTAPGLFDVLNYLDAQRAPL